MGTGQTMLGSYDMVLLGFVGCMILSCSLMAFVGKYPDLELSDQEPEAAATKAQTSQPKAASTMALHS